MNENVKVLLIGYGTVGEAVHRLLVERESALQALTGCSIEITGAVVRDMNKNRECPAGSKIEFFSEFERGLDTSPDVVLELAGGADAVKDYVLDALSSGTGVVTANKQMVARYATELDAAATAGQSQLYFEASTCAAIPIIGALEGPLATSQINRIYGILNGTTNFILTSMFESETDFASALAMAQDLGYAEADPTEDVEGIDAAAKLTILGSLAFHRSMPIDDISVEGITAITADDVLNSMTLGGRIKLIGMADRSGEKVTLNVAPMLVPGEHPLAHVGGATNAVVVEGEPFDRLVFEGPGAGGGATASAVVGDLLRFIKNRKVNRPVNRFSSFEEGTNSSTAAPDCRWYVRLTVDDRPGVLADVAGVLAGQEISIEQVLQHPQHESSNQASLMLVTHPTTRKHLDAALQETSFHDATVLRILEA